MLYAALIGCAGFLIISGLSAGGSIGRIHDVILRSLRVHLVVMHIHLEDLLDLKIVLRSALRIGSRLIYRVTIVLHGVGQRCTISESKCNFLCPTRRILL